VALGHPPTAADKGEVFVFQKITSVWLTGNGKDKEVALEIGLEGCLCDESQTSLQALPARPRRPPTAAGKGVALEIEKNGRSFLNGDRMFL
jgi:hypothetical protein